MLIIIDYIIMEQKKQLFNILFSYYYAQKNKDFSSLFENEEYENSLFGFQFLHDFHSHVLKRIRTKLNWDIDHIKKFWDEHISYRFLKPKFVGFLIDWIKTMFFNRSFTEAYSKENRTKMSLRLTKYAKAAVLMKNIEYDDIVEETTKEELEKKKDEIYEFLEEKFFKKKKKISWLLVKNFFQ